MGRAGDGCTDDHRGHGKPAFGFDSEIDGFQVLISQQASGHIDADTMTVEYNNPVVVQQLTWFAASSTRACSVWSVRTSTFPTRSVRRQSPRTPDRPPATGSSIRPSPTTSSCVAPLPQGGEREYISSWGGGWMVFKTDEAKQRAAFEFLKWLESPEVLARWATEFGGVPAYPAAIAQPVFQDFAAGNPAIQAQTEQINRVGFLPAVKGSAALRTVIGRAVASACTGVSTPGGSAADGRTRGQRRARLSEQLRPWRRRRSSSSASTWSTRSTWRRCGRCPTSVACWPRAHTWRTPSRSTRRSPIRATRRSSQATTSSGMACRTIRWCHEVLGEMAGGRDLPAFTQRGSIRCETLLDAAREQGRSTCSLSWPVTGGADFDLNMPMIVPMYYDGPEPIQFLEGNATPELLDRYYPKHWQYLTGPERSLDRYTMALATEILRDDEQPDVMLVKLCDLDTVRHAVGVDNHHTRAELAGHDAEARCDHRPGRPARRPRPHQLRRHRRPRPVRHRGPPQPQRAVPA